MLFNFFISLCMCNTHAPECIPTHLHKSGDSANCLFLSLSYSFETGSLAEPEASSCLEASKPQPSSLSDTHAELQVQVCGVQPSCYVHPGTWTLVLLTMHAAAVPKQWATSPASVSYSVSRIILCIRKWHQNLDGRVISNCFIIFLQLFPPERVLM